MSIKTKILDCTLRDGGYYTNWDFDNSLVKDYLKLTKMLPIDIIEIGYRGNANKHDYYGEFYYLTKSNLKKIKSFIGKNKKLSIMVDTKDWNNSNELKKNLFQCKGIVDIVRFAVKPKETKKIIGHLKVAKELGFAVALNLMYSHLILNDKKIISPILKLKKYFDILYIVDSYGTLISGEVEEIIKYIKSLDNKIQIGFHAHNNLELALSNSIEAMDNGVSYVDSTFTGMGRGAGNLKTELLLTYLSLKKNILKIKNFKNMANVIDQFEEIKLKEKWGTSLPYMISASTKSPQSEAMNLIKSKRYNLTDIITYLSKKNNRKIEVKKKLTFKKNNVLIIGGGDSVKIKLNYINELLKTNLDLFVVFSSSRNLKLFKKIKNSTITCITGNEINKIEPTYLKRKDFIINDIIDDKTILPSNLSNFYKLRKNSYNKKINNSPLSIALSVAQEVKAQKIYLIGFDGYEKVNKVNDHSLFNENQKILDFYSKRLNLLFLTDTIYENVKKSSIYKYLS